MPGPSASSAGCLPALICGSSTKWRPRSTTATICVSCRSSPTAPPPISTICSIFTASTRRSRSPTCSSISAPCARRRISISRVQYIIRLPISELHILARDDVHSLEDLRGKKVNFGPAGTGASLTGTIVFQRLGITFNQVMIDQSSALQKLKIGEIDAIARVIPKPVDFFSKIPPNSGLHLVNIPFTIDVRGSLHARRIHQAGLSESARRQGSHRHHRGAGGARGVQLADGYGPLSQGRALRAIFVQQFRTSCSSHLTIRSGAT